MTKKLAILALSVLFTGTQASANGIDLGMVKLFPTAGYKLTSDNNIFLKESGETASIYHTGTVGLNFKAGLDRIKIGGGYKFDLLRYDKAPNANDAEHQDAKFDVAYAVPDMWSFKLRENYIVTTDPASSELTQRELRFGNNAGAEFNYDGHSMVAAKVTMDHAITNYRNAATGDQLDRDELTAGLRVSYKYSPKTKFFVGYKHKIIDYDVDSSSQSNSANVVEVGVDGQLLPKLKGELRAGVTLRDFDKTVGGRSELNTGHYGGNLVWDAPYKVNTTVSLSRRLVEGTFNRAYISDRIGLNLKKTWMEKLDTGFNTSFARDNYPDQATGFTGKRKDDFWDVGVSAKYALMEYVDLMADYKHQQRAANAGFTSFDYTLDVVNVGFTLKL